MTTSLFAPVVAEDDGAEPSCCLPPDILGVVTDDISPAYSIAVAVSAPPSLSASPTVAAIQAIRGTPRSDRAASIQKAIVTLSAQISGGGGGGGQLPSRSHSLGSIIPHPPPAALVSQTRKNFSANALLSSSSPASAPSSAPSSSSPSPTTGLLVTPALALSPPLGNPAPMMRQMGHSYPRLPPATPPLPGPLQLQQQLQQPQQRIGAAARWSLPHSLSTPLIFATPRPIAPLPAFQARSQSQQVLRYGQPLAPSYHPPARRLSLSSVPTRSKLQPAAPAAPAASRHLASCRLTIVDIYRRLFPGLPTPPRDLVFDSNAWKAYVEDRQAAAQLYYRRDCGGVQRQAWVRVPRHPVANQAGDMGLGKARPSPKPRPMSRSPSVLVPSLVVRPATAPTTPALQMDEDAGESVSAPTSPLLSLLRRQKQQQQQQQQQPQQQYQTPQPSTAAQFQLQFPQFPYQRASPVTAAIFSQQYSNQRSGMYWPTVLQQPPPH